ncbi:uncharacterized protein LOC142351677 [Convolutriloba macropyga]|uniref:uncharacterized protein LOC142351677 n=1 Tax=Convolutriloba macropyga TaxID=536237 RepID=UPI003F51FE31
MLPHVPLGGHYAHGYHGYSHVPQVPLFRTYWRSPVQPPNAARGHLTMSDRRHMGELMSHYKAVISNLQGEIECMSRDACERHDVMEEMVKLLEENKQKEAVHHVEQQHNNLLDWQKLEASKMEGEIERVKDIASEIVNEVEDEAQQLKEELEGVQTVVQPDGQFTKKAKRKVKSAVIEAVERMQETGVLPSVVGSVGDEEFNRQLMSELSKLEGKMDSQKDRQINQLKRQITQKDNAISVCLLYNSI